MKRQIIEIDEELCDGCGDCIPECHEGALQIIDGKARLISDLFCDGLGACIGHCPQGAIRVVEKEAEPYNEIKVLDEMINKPPSVLKAHLQHLLDHKANEYLYQAISYLKNKGMTNPLDEKSQTTSNKTLGGCPGSQTISLNDNSLQEETTFNPSELRQWPIQLHLVNPNAPYFKDSELVIMSTCGPLTNANIHRDYLKGRSVVIACPKLDYTDPYTDKLAQIFQTGNIKKAIVVIMQVPCCSGLAKFSIDAKEISKRKDMEIEIHILSLEGNLLQVKRA